MLNFTILKDERNIFNLNYNDITLIFHLINKNYFLDIAETKIKYLKPFVYYSLKLIY
jgi:hypothetical protein